MALFTVVIIGLFIIQPTSSYADWHGHDGGGHGHDGGHHGHSYVGVNFSVWPDNYNYGAVYYPPDEAVLVSSPVYEPEIFNGTTYYLNNGSYYIYNGYGYQAVAPPVTIVQQPVAVEAPPQVVTQEESAQPVITSAGAASDSPDSITINIPNNKGGYTAVTLKKSGNGFIGPQGEFYPEFPKVSQLEIIYGK